jgi:hypothetical protein
MQGCCFLSKQCAVASALSPSRRAMITNPEIGLSRQSSRAQREAGLVLERAVGIRRFAAPPQRRARPGPDYTPVLTLSARLSTKKGHWRARSKDELGERIGKRGVTATVGPLPADPLSFARSLGTTVNIAEVPPLIVSRNGIIGNGCACPPSSIRIWRRSKAGSRRSRRSRRSPSCVGWLRSIQPPLAISSIRSCSA